MYRKIIVGLDGRAEGMDALDLATMLARASDADLIAASIFPAGASNGQPQHPRRQLQPVAPQPRQAEAARAGVAGAAVKLQARAVVGDSTPRSLHRLAELEAADLIVLGSSHRGPIGRIVPGSTASRLLDEAPCAIAVAPRGFSQREHTGLREIAVGYDGLAESRAALYAAEDLAAAEDARLLLLAVAEPAPLGAGYAIPVATMTAGLQKRLNKGVAGVRAEVDAAGETLCGRAGPALLAWAKRSDVDLIVVGSRAYGPIRRALLGSVAARLMHGAPCPVLVVPRPGARQKPSGDRTAELLR